MIEWPVILSTVRLTLRPFRPQDAPDVSRLAGDREVAANTLTVPHPYEEGMASEWIAGHAPAAAAGERVVFALVHEAGLVGAMGLDFAPEHARAELGYWVGRPSWGQGFASEAARELVRYGFEVLGLNRIQAHHMVRNPASGRVLETFTTLVRPGQCKTLETGWTLPATGVRLLMSQDLRLGIDNLSYITP